MMDAFEIKYTRAAYMAGECTFEQYYGQFVDRETRRRVLFIATPQELAEKIAEDKHLNNISLRKWDALVEIPWPRRFADGFKAAGTWMSLSDGVCILKETARQMAAEYMAAKESE